MGKRYEGIDPKMAGWLAEQPVFFVATAPLAGDGLVNLSPKGLLGTFRVLDEHTVAYLDLTGSGVETLAHLRGKGFNFLASVHGVDYWPEEPRFGVHYELLDMHEVDRMTVKVRVPLDAPSVPSVVADWPTADHQEREIYDMFGVVFDGHPDLRRILMPEDYVGWPQRRDFPVGGEPVLFTIDEAEGTAYTR